MDKEKYEPITYGKVYGDGPYFHLPHQCDSWIIGDIEKAKDFAINLLNIIEDVESGKVDAKDIPEDYE